MTVSSQVAKVVYSGNGSNTNFPITFPFLNSVNNLGVYLSDSLGVITKLSETQFNFVSDESKIIYPKSGAPLTSGNKITIIREVQSLQEVDLLNQGPFSAEVIESMHDKSMMLIQQIDEKVTRCIQYPVDANPSATDTTSYLSTLQALRDESVASANNAANSEAHSATSENNAQVYATSAATSAANAAAAASAAVAADIAAAVANLVNTSPASLDTLGELAQALGNDPNFATTITNLIGLKRAKKSDTFSNLSTWASTAENGEYAYATDKKLIYFVVDGLLQEAAIMRTISGTPTQIQKTVGLTAVRLTVSNIAPDSNRKKLIFQPDASNTGKLYYGGPSVTIATGTPIIGPDRLVFEWDATDYWIISDTASQTVSIIEVV